MFDLVFGFTFAITAILVLVVVNTLIRPFICDIKDIFHSDTHDFDKIEEAESEEIFLSSLEEIEISKKRGLIGSEEYDELREMLINDMKDSD